MIRRLPPLLLLAVFALAMWLLAGRPLPPAGHAWPALLVALAGIAVALAGVVSFRRAGTTVDPRHPGKVSALVRSGIYARTRNPMYLGFLLLLTGWALWLDSLLAGVLLALYFLWLDRVQIPAEETAIEGLFGAAFQAYCAAVRRWL